MRQMFHFRDCVFKPKEIIVENKNVYRICARSCADLEPVTCNRLLEKFPANFSVYP